MSEKISVVTSATDIETQDYDASKVIEAIRTGGKKLRGQVEEIRATMRRELTRHGDEKRAKQTAGEIKKQLPAVMWCGTFSSREKPASDKLISHSGLLCADLDSLNGELPAVREKLSDSPYLWTLFESPSGDGLKAVFRVPADLAKHAGSFRAVEQHVKRLTGVQIDEACKDVARLCFLSYDPELIHKANAREIEPLPEPEKPCPITNGMVNLSERQRITTELLGTVDWQSETSGFVACPGKHLHKSGDGERDCKVELDSVPTAHCFHNSCRGILEGVNHELRSRIGKGEYIPDNATARSSPQGEDVPIELPPAPAPYVPPALTLLPATVRDYISAAAESLNVDVSFILLPLLSALGSAIGNTRSIQLKPGFSQPPVIWTGIIGRSGARKSPALENGCFPVTEHERELARQNKTDASDYDEELATWEVKGRKEHAPKPKPKPAQTCMMDDLTLATLADAIQRNPRGVLVRKDELSHWFASFDQYHNAKGADVSRWLSLHSGFVFGLDRRTDERSYRIFQPRVSITGGIQPRVLARVLTEDFFERGLPARFLFADPPMRPDRWSEAIIPDRLRAAVLELFGELWLLHPEHDANDNPRPASLTLEPDAKEAFVAYYNDCGDAALAADEHTEAAWGKLSGYAARLALVGQLTANPNATTVTGEVMRAACDLARWFGAEAARIYASIAETADQRETRKLVEFIKSRGGPASVRDVTHYHWPFRNQPDKAEQALSGLVKKGLGIWLEIKPEGRGRPTRKFQLLQASPSPKFPDLRGETPNYGDGEGVSGQKNTESGEPIEDAQPDSFDRRVEEAKRLFNAVPSEPNKAK
jgi:hypothetical protein